MNSWIIFWASWLGSNDFAPSNYVTMGITRSDGVQIDGQVTYTPYWSEMVGPIMVTHWDLASRSEITDLADPISYNELPF